MGTRADFYVGRGKSAEWLGSIAFDGYPDAIPRSIKSAKTEADYRAAVDRFLRKSEGRFAADGWPWPWKNGHLTDYSYAFDGGRTYACKFGDGWFFASRKEPEDGTDDPCEFPDMSSTRQSLSLAGMIVVSS